MSPFTRVAEAFGMGFTAKKGPNRGQTADYVTRANRWPPSLPEHGAHRRFG